MKAMMPGWLGFYDGEGCIQSVRQELVTMSKSTIDAYLKPARADWRRKHNTGTKAARPQVQSWVPVKSVGYKAKRVGHIEVDTVAHCGDSMSGKFFWTLTMTDVVSGWTTATVVWNKDSHEIKESLIKAESISFFKWEFLSSDCGSEFLNKKVVLEFCRDPRRSSPIQQFRGRPYKSNDQCFVEQKNNVFVRQFMGYERLDVKLMQSSLNSIYEDWAKINNHFIPQSKLFSKLRIGSKIKKVYDEPRTPFERLFERQEVTLADKARLIEEHRTINPIELRKSIRKRLNRIFNWHEAELKKRGKATA